VWDPACVTDAARTNSTTKAACVVELAPAEGIVERRGARIDSGAHGARHRW